MPKKQTNAQKLIDICERECQALGYELCDAGFEKEPSGMYLRVYIDKTEGSISLDDCERVHRKIQPLLDSFDYDFMEICSPGIDRPLKREKDILKNIGNPVEVHLYKAVEKAKVFFGVLEEMNRETVRIAENGVSRAFSASDVSQVRLVPDLSALEDDAADEMETLDVQTIDADEASFADLGDGNHGAEE